MATQIWVNIGSANGLLPDGTWAKVDLSSVRSSEIHLGTISEEIPQPLITKMSLKITHLQFFSNLPGGNELND